MLAAESRRSRQGETYLPGCWWSYVGVIYGYALRDGSLSYRQNANRNRAYGLQWTLKTLLSNTNSPEKLSHLSTAQYHYNYPFSKQTQSQLALPGLRPISHSPPFPIIYSQRLPRNIVCCGGASYSQPYETTYSSLSHPKQNQHNHDFSIHILSWKLTFPDYYTITKTSFNYYYRNITFHD